jgi:hypothetical protein
MQESAAAACHDALRPRRRRVGFAALSDCLLHAPRESAAPPGCARDVLCLAQQACALRQ